MTFVDEELASQPECWARAIAMARGEDLALPVRGERVAVVGCGTSWFIAMSYAALREGAGQGETDAFAGSEYPAEREYDRVVVISRSGTTTEIINVLRAVSAPTVLITGVPDSPAAAVADHTVALEFADERSVVQTRFATTTLSLLRSHVGEDLAPLLQDANAALQLPIDDFLEATQISFLGRGWTIGLAHEAALKCREAAQLWTESYPAMDYRHGPIAIAEPDRLVFTLGEWPLGLDSDIARTGARFVELGDLDGQAALIVAQRIAVAAAKRRGLDPDNPRNLTRSVILEDAAR